MAHDVAVREAGVRDRRRDRLVRRRGQAGRGGAIEVDASVEVVVSEGNYLLAELAPWPEVRSAFDEVWFVDTPAGLRRRWLVARHVRFGMTPEAAEAWAAGPDEANARLVRATRARADVVVDAGRLWPDA